MSTRAQAALRVFPKHVETADYVTDLHNAFFRIYGKLGKMFPTCEEREGIAQTPEYAEMKRINLKMREQEASATR